MFEMSNTFKIPRKKGQKASLRGMARTPEIRPMAKIDRGQGIQAQSLVFNLEVESPDGAVTDFVPVSLEGWEIRGNLVDGDQVTVEGKFDEYHILKVKEIYKENTRSFVSAKHFASRGRTILKYLLGLVIIVAIGWYVIRVLSY